jgi:hypothetical protein
MQKQTAGICCATAGVCSAAAAFLQCVRGRSRSNSPPHYGFQHTKGPNKKEKMVGGKGGAGGGGARG